MENPLLSVVFCTRLANTETRLSLGIPGFRKHSNQKIRKFSHRMEVGRASRYDVLHAAAQVIPYSFSLDPKLNNKSVIVQQSFHHDNESSERGKLSHKTEVMLKWCFGGNACEL